MQFLFKEKNEHKKIHTPQRKKKQTFEEFYNSWQFEIII